MKHLLCAKPLPGAYKQMLLIAAQRERAPFAWSPTVITSTVTECTVAPNSIPFQLPALSHTTLGTFSKHQVSINSPALTHQYASCTLSTSFGCSILGIFTFPVHVFKLLPLFSDKQRMQCLNYCKQLKRRSLEGCGQFFTFIVT